MNKYTPLQKLLVTSAIIIGKKIEIMSKIKKENKDMMKEIDLMIEMWDAKNLQEYLARKYAVELITKKYLLN